MSYRYTRVERQLNYVGKKLSRSIYLNCKEMNKENPSEEKLDSLWKEFKDLDSKYDLLLRRFNRKRFSRYKRTHCK